VTAKDREVLLGKKEGEHCQGDGDHEQVDTFRAHRYRAE